MNTTSPRTPSAARPVPVTTPDPDTPELPALTIDSLTKRYSGRTVVDGLSFSCLPGTVTGFLGPNGAGKSTTLRILTSFARADDGRALIDGVEYRDLPHPARTVGVMLDAGALHRGRTGLETLRLAAAACGMPRERADEVLRLVGLDGAGKKRVGGYSYGMRQRLGIGVALVGDPRVLILDEPANGLDPEGIRWMRDLLRAFADAGGTVLLSSHQLREVQATVDRLVVISHGRLVHEGPVDAIERSGSTRVGADDPARLGAALDRAGVAYERRADGTCDVALPAADVGRLALREQVVLTALGPAADGGLEELFFSLTEDAPAAASAGAAPVGSAPARQLAPTA